MNMLKLKRWWIVALIVALALSGHSAAQAAAPVVRAVLFYSPTCPHCHQVMTVDLPPLLKQYGDRLNIVGINVTEAAGLELYTAAQTRFNIGPDRYGVPTLIVGEVVLVGSLEIPEQLPGLIEQYLAQGGVDWPDIPGLAEVVAPTEESVATPEPSSASAAPVNVSSTTASIDIGANLARDPLANGLAIMVLVGMIASVSGVSLRLRRSIGLPRSRRFDWLIPVLCVIGLGVAGYLTYVETAQVAAVCGPIGDCNAVQQSDYARLFGVVPIGLLGLIGYVAIIAAWWIERLGHAPFDRLAALLLVIMTLGGTLFSIYLTFLEPFVIGATCAWCLASAVIMTSLLWLAARRVMPG
jgi:uncharacterized membrane protein/thiol-disulfide isomerase/thioredoxin